MHNSVPALSHNESRWFLWYKTAGNQKKKKKKKNRKRDSSGGCRIRVRVWEPLWSWDSRGRRWHHRCRWFYEAVRHRQRHEHAPWAQQYHCRCCHHHHHHHQSLRRRRSCRGCNVRSTTTHHGNKTTNKPTTAWRSPVLNGIFVANKTPTKWRFKGNLHLLEWCFFALVVTYF